MLCYSQYGRVKLCFDNSMTEMNFLRIQRQLAFYSRRPSIRGHIDVVNPNTSVVEHKFDGKYNSISPPGPLPKMTDILKRTFLVLVESCTGTSKPHQENVKLLNRT